MDLVVATPGVATESLRAALDSAVDRSAADSQLTVARTTRCGSTTVDPSRADRLRLAVVPCRISLHAAQRFRDQLAGGQSVDRVIVRGELERSAYRLGDRFDCPITVTGEQSA